MVTIASLWLPILLAAVVVFIASSVMHMVLKYHHSEIRSVPREVEVMDALRPFAVPPGEYMLPKAADMKAMGTPEFQEKLRQGPVMLLQVYPNGPFSMGRSLAMWFVYSLVINVFAAYVAGRALGPGAEYLAVFRYAGVTAFLGYAAALWQGTIWYGRAWTSTAKHTFDGLVYALLTAGMFGALWPS